MLRLVPHVAVLLAIAGCRDRPAVRADAGAEVVHASAEPAEPTVGQRMEAAVRGADVVARAGAIRQAAAMAVKGQLAVEDGSALLRAAPAIPAPEGGVDPQATLIDAVVIGMRAEYVAVLDEIADGLRREARERVLVALAMKDVPGAMKALVAIVTRHPAEEQPAMWVALETARKGRGRELMALVAEPALRSRAIHVARVHCDERVLDKHELAESEKMLVGAYRDAVLLGRPEARELLHLFACLPKGTIDKVLREALKFEDVELALAAAESLLAHRQKIPPAVLERLAAADETRARLFEMVPRKKFPKGWRTQEALARSIMVEWVNEQGHEVEEIELVELVPVEIEEEGTLDHFVFRYRTTEGVKWEFGVAGPFRHDDAPTTDDHGGTTSGRKVDAKAVKAEFGATDPD